MHTMIQIGNGLWHCPDCGRRIRLHLTPFEVEVLEEGAPVPHQGGGLQMSFDVAPGVPDEFSDFLEGIE